MLRKILTSACMLASFFLASAQDSTKAPAFKLTGSADVYYRYNFQNPKSAPYNNFTSFTNSQNSFELGMASIKLEHSIGKVGMVADLGYGRRADEYSYNDAGSRVAIKQLYISYSPSSKVKLTLGSWGTHIGYEVLDAYLNRNYSMSYMFSYGPFFHTGIKSEFTLSSKSVLMIGVANPTDFKTASTMPKMVIAQLATGSKDDKLKAYLNYQGGNFNDSGRLYQEDIVLTYALSTKFGLGYNGTFQSKQSRINNKWISGNNWWGSALYINLDPVSYFGLTLRGEYLSDKKNVLGFNGSVFESTLSANFKVDNLIIIPEFRLDNGSYSPGLFQTHQGAATKSTESFILAAVYKF